MEMQHSEEEEEEKKQTLCHLQLLPEVYLHPNIILLFKILNINCT
jgi:hypothetical protein